MFIHSFFEEEAAIVAVVKYQGITFIKIPHYLKVCTEALNNN